MIDLFPNSTFFIQLAIFLSVVLVLSKGVFKPVLDLFDARKRASSDAIADLSRLEELLSEKDARVAHLLKEARTEALGQKEKIHAEAVRREQELIEKARHEGEAVLAKVRGEIKTEVATARTALEQESKAFSTLIVQKVLSRRNLDKALSTALLLLFSTPLFAEEAHHVEGPSLALLFQFINFALLATVLIVVLKKPLRELFSSRKAQIEGAIDEAKKRREGFSLRAREIEKRLAKLDTEIGDLKKMIIGAAELEKSAIIERGESLAQKIKEDLSRRADEEVRHAREELRALSVDLALRGARGELERILKAPETELSFDRATLAQFKEAL